MRVTDWQGVEYEVIYDAERALYVYTKVFKPSANLHTVGEPATSSAYSHEHTEESHQHA